MNTYYLKFPFFNEGKDIIKTSGPIPRIGDTIGSLDIQGKFKVKNVCFIYDNLLKPQYPMGLPSTNEPQIIVEIE